MRIDIVTDIETLGNKTDSSIIQLSAIAFDMETGKHIKTFNEIIDIDKCDNVKITGGTLKWWLNTDKALLADLLNREGRDIKQVLVDFACWVRELNSDQTETYLWGNGILFDNKMIQYQMEQAKVTYPIYYRNDRDMRTLIDLACKKLNLTEKELRASLQDKKLIAHDALNDVINQIKIISYCYNILTR